MRKFTALFLFALLFAFQGAVMAQDDANLAEPQAVTQPADASAPAQPADTTTADDSLNDTGAAPVEGSGSFDSVQASANQAFSAMMNRQFQGARQLYETAAGSNPEYQKMVDFCNAVLKRIQEMTDKQIELFAKTTAPNFRIETLSKEEVDQMLDYQFRQQQAGQGFVEMGELVNTTVAELGLDFEGSDRMTLGEYLGWLPPRGANARIWQRARLRALDRQKVFAKFEIYQQQRQEHMQRMEEFRRRKLERQSGGFGGISGGGGMSFGGGFGGGGFGGGGFGGGGFGGGGFGGGGGF